MPSEKAKKQTRKQPGGDFDVHNFLRSWATVQSSIGELKPEQLLTALKVEKNGKNRPSIIARLATRYDNATKTERIRDLI